MRLRLPVQAILLDGFARHSANVPGGVGSRDTAQEGAESPPLIRRCAVVAEPFAQFKTADHRTALSGS